ncbi:hypothetical protein E4T56_gene20269 [Termitomyces sp. T112]|nr:hypothetical protein E4T56_gene20269 [Termitomyces sp. T112]
MPPSPTDALHQAAGILRLVLFGFPSARFPSASCPVPENQYAPFYLGLPADQYVPCHWTPDPNHPSAREYLWAGTALHQSLH